MGGRILTSFSIFRSRTYKYHFDEWDFEKNWTLRKLKRRKAEANAREEV
jgi:hypothetical protein